VRSDRADHGQGESYVEVQGSTGPLAPESSEVCDDGSLTQRGPSSDDTARYDRRECGSVPGQTGAPHTHRAAGGAGGADAERFGFQDGSTHPEALRLATERRLEGDIDLDSPTYFLSRITISVTHSPVTHRGRKRLFVAVARTAAGRVDLRLLQGWQVRL
jgi:hypothetical protein